MVHFLVLLLFLLQDCYRICAMLKEDGPPVVMFNPRLASGDVGIGLNVRKMQQNFLRSGGNQANDTLPL